jgi:hypothetical protein
MVVFGYAAYPIVNKYVFVHTSKYLETRRISFAAGLVCVFFAQQSVEKRPKGLWEGPFFIA